ncbi:hypothetical protein ACVDG8_037625 (plasmid) [Mesorhizobium sp. ORM8.1]
MFTLTVVEPMMVGLLGGCMALLRTADGETRVLDGNCAVPSAARPDLFQPLPLSHATNMPWLIEPIPWGRSPSRYPARFRRGARCSGAGANSHWPT